MSEDIQGIRHGVKPNFEVGDCVRILPTMATPFVGLRGIIEQAIPHPRSVSQLDTYVVSFSWGEKQKFWSVQLEQSRKAA